MTIMRHRVSKFGLVSSTVIVAGLAGSPEGAVANTRVLAGTACQGTQPAQPEQATFDGTSAPDGDGNAAITCFLGYDNDALDSVSIRVDSSGNGNCLVTSTSQSGATVDYVTDSIGSGVQSVTFNDPPTHYAGGYYSAGCDLPEDSVLFGVYYVES